MLGSSWWAGALGALGSSWREEEGNWEHWDPPGGRGGQTGSRDTRGGGRALGALRSSGGQGGGTGSTGVLLGVPKNLGCWGGAGGHSPNWEHWDDPGVAAPQTGSTGVLLGTWVFPKLGALGCSPCGRHPYWEHWGAAGGGIPQAGGTGTFSGVSPKLGALEPTRSWAPPNWEHWDPPSPCLGASPLTPGGMGTLGHLPPPPAKPGAPQTGSTGAPHTGSRDPPSPLHPPQLVALGLPQTRSPHRETTAPPNWSQKGASNWEYPKWGTPNCTGEPPRTGITPYWEHWDPTNTPPPNWDTPKLPPWCSQLSPPKSQLSAPQIQTQLSGNRGVEAMTPPKRWGAPQKAAFWGC